MSDANNVWAIAETRDGAIDPVSFEVLTAGRRLADTRGSELWCVVLGKGVGAQAPRAIEAGADRVLVVDDPALGSFVEETWAKTIARLAATHDPETILTAATFRGQSLMPRLSVILKTGMSSDCTAVEIDADTGRLTQTRPAYGGTKTAIVKTPEARPQLCSIRPRAYEPMETDEKRQGEVLSEQFDAADNFEGKKISAEVREEGVEIKLADASIIVAGGRGLKGPEGFQLLEQFARSLGGAVAASRAAVDSGWVAYPHQVGQTGQTVQSQVYIACGISGQIQHLVGMQSSDFIVAINKDPDAPIMKLADVAVVGDAFEIIPHLMKRIKAG